MVEFLVGIVLKFDNNHYLGIATGNTRRYDYNIF